MKAWKSIVIGIIFLVVFFSLFFAIVRYASINPKIPATAKQVQEVLVSLGYEPQDITEQFINQDPNTIQCIAAQKNDIRFEFYMFNNVGSAINAFGSAHSYIVRKRNALPRVEGKWQRANYCIYTLEAKGVYSVAIYVGPTAVYAYSNTDNAKEINKILRTINYSVKPGKFAVNLNKIIRASNMPEKALVHVIAFILLIPMIWISARWLWSLVCQSAGVTKQEVRLYRIKVRHQIKPYRIVYLWMLSQSKNPKKFKRLFTLYQACTIPNLLCLNLAIVNLFAKNDYFYQFLDGASYVMVTLPLVLTIAGVIYRKIKR